MANILNLSRQNKLVPKDKIDEYTIEVFGIGSVGSHVIKTLAKTGFTNIKAYDMDKVEEENIAAQAFDFRHEGLQKTEAIKQIVKESCGFDINVFDGEIKEDTLINAEPKTIYCCFFDSFEGRKMVFNKLKDYPVIFIDGRIGMYDMRHYLIDCSDKEQIESYEKTLATKAVSELVCGEKASAPINIQIAGMIVMNIINYITGADYEKAYIGNAKQRSMDIRIPVIREAK